MHSIMKQAVLLTAAVSGVIDLSSAQNVPQLEKRSGCSTTTVQYGDGCPSLASRCGISGSQFTQYNPQPNLCSSLEPGQKVCCTAGGLPTPQQNANGTCASYTVQHNDTCTGIANSNNITPANLNAWNNNTWGWNPCPNLSAGLNICLSTGTPPMPVPLNGTVCGPQVPGTTRPTNGSSLASLNPCPLNACCDIWGQCGTTSDFCTPSGTGAPGTASAPYPNGCISNCGTNITNNGSPPSSFKKVAYYESFSYQRPCLNMGVNQINTSQYTHIHYAFGNVNADFSVDANDNLIQFMDLLNLQGVKRIITFGGWGFSTSPSTYNVLRSGVTPANRQTFASNIANFVKTNGLDGVDIDWEYPGETDIAGIPADNATDAANYLGFLQTLKGLLPSGTTLSIAAPASFWYLKAFPIANMSQTVDYIVFMTYDLHGQWDWNNSFADPGCPQGSCLRSHVNLTETINALSMITKAGVPSNKVVVGVSSYGRSFQMTSAGCTGPMCTFTGPNSGAWPGPCTQTQGYIADAEIYQIIQENPSAVASFDTSSNSNILVFNSTNWVGYMNSTTKASRTSLYQSLNMGGTADWAVDLETYEDFTAPNPTLPSPTSTQTSQPTSSPGTGEERKPPGVLGALNPILQDCSGTQAGMVSQAWQEASDIASAHYDWVPNVYYQPAMSAYLGNNTANDFSFWFGKGPIEKTVLNQYNIHWASWINPPRWTYLYFFCDYTKVPGYDPIHEPICDSGTEAVTFSDTTSSSYWYAHYTIFCPYFYSRSLISLAQTAAYAQTDPIIVSTIDYWAQTRAAVMYHETWHYNLTVSNPVIPDQGQDGYEPEWCYETAQTNQNIALQNAESWTLAGLAIYVQQTFKTQAVPTPISNPPTYSITPWTGAMPSGFVGPFNPNNQTWTPPSNLNISFVSDWTTLELGNTYLPGCTPGWYTATDQCNNYCAGGTCTNATNQNAQGQQNQSVSCGSCPSAPTVCNAGSTYDDFNTCYENCNGGQCFEDSEYTGVVCQVCPGGTRKLKQRWLDYFGLPFL